MNHAASLLPDHLEGNASIVLNNFETGSCREVSIVSGGQTTKWRVHVHECNLKCVRDTKRVDEKKRKQIFKVCSCSFQVFKMLWELPKKGHRYF